MCKKSFITIFICFCVIAIQIYRKILKKYRKREITLQFLFKKLRKIVFRYLHKEFYAKIHDKVRTRSRSHVMQLLTVSSARMTDFWRYLGQIGLKWNKSGTLSDQISVHIGSPRLGSTRQNVLKSNLKKSLICPILVLCI